MKTITRNNGVVINYSDTVVELIAESYKLRFDIEDSIRETVEKKFRIKFEDITKDDIICYSQSNRTFIESDIEEFRNSINNKNYFGVDDLRKRDLDTLTRISKKLLRPIDFLK